MRLIIIICLGLIGSHSFGQTDSTQIEKKEIKIDSASIKASKHGNLLSYLYELQQISGEDNIKHKDTISGYSIVIPLWWKIKETPNTSMFGGIFPAIDKVRNALIFKAFNKSEYESIENFREWVITDYKLGEIPKWSNNHKILLQQKLEDFKDIGKAYKVQLTWNGRLYHCCYILIETSNSYLWIDFTATKETYEINFPKLKKLMKKYKTL